MKGTHVEIYPILYMTYCPILGTKYELRNIAEVTHSNMPELNNNDKDKALKGGKSIAYEASTTITLSKGSSYTENEMGENPNVKP